MSELNFLEVLRQRMSGATKDDPLIFAVFDPLLKVLSPADLQALPKGAIVTSVDIKSRSFNYSVPDPHPLMLSFGAPPPEPLIIHVFSVNSCPSSLTGDIDSKTFQK